MKNTVYTIVLLCFFSCASPENNSTTITNEKPRDYGTALVWEKNGIVVYEALVENDMENASLKLVSPIEPSTGPTQFEFAVDNYELGTQTADAASRSCANSAKGQHIHFILNNQPYKAHYSNTFEEDMPEGTNVLLAFLSRSYHESIKSPSAHAIVKYGRGGQEIDEPLLFYSRPKGSYSVEDGNKLLLDFYLRNVSLSESGFKVRATIDGEVFILPKWCPYFVEGLSTGDHTFHLELIDPEGNPVKNMKTESGESVVGPYSNCGERLVTITAG